LPKTILEHRQLSRLMATMRTALPEHEAQCASQIMVSCSIQKSRGKVVAMSRIKGTFLQTSSASGRICMDGPNLQCVPNPKEIAIGANSQSQDNSGQQKVLLVNPREAFKTIEEYVILTADYAQLELRIMAHFSSDPILLSCIEGGQDFFKTLAAGWRNVDLDSVTPEMRTKAKRLAYGILYGMGARALAGELDCDMETARAEMETFKARLGGVAKWMAGVVRDVEKHGYIQTLGGRKRYFEDFRESVRAKRQISPDHRAAVERKAINTVCQGSAADIVKRAMIAIRDGIRSDLTLRDRCHMILEIHDELMFEVRCSSLVRASSLVRECMVQAWKGLQVPLAVRMKVGQSWGEATDYAPS